MDRRRDGVGPQSDTTDLCACWKERQIDFVVEPDHLDPAFVVDEYIGMTVGQYPLHVVDPDPLLPATRHDVAPRIWRSPLSVGVGFVQDWLPPADVRKVQYVRSTSPHYQSMATNTSIPQLDLIGVVVEDMAGALAFYRQLGLDIPTEADTRPHAEATLPGGMRLAWDTVETVRSFDPDFRAPASGSRIGLAFRLPSPAAVDATYEQLVAAGCHGHKAPWGAGWGQRYALIHDPDGNSVDLFAPLPSGGEST